MASIPSNCDTKDFLNRLQSNTEWKVKVNGSRVVLDYHLTKARLVMSLKPTESKQEIKESIKDLAERMGSGWDVQRLVAVMWGDGVAPLPMEVRPSSATREVASALHDLQHTEDWGPTKRRKEANEKIDRM